MEAQLCQSPAEETHRSQSSVSYNLSLLQEGSAGAAGPGGATGGVNSGRRTSSHQVKPLLKAFSYVETRAATLRNGCERG